MPYLTPQIAKPARHLLWLVGALIAISRLMVACENPKKLPGQNPQDSANVTKSPPTQDTTEEDPYFVSTTDTVATHGPRSITRNCLQDRNGIYWFATWEGIIRYDGHIFTNMTLQAGLRRIHTFAVLEDHLGNLWFGTIGGGVYRHDPVAKTWTNLTVAEGLASDRVTCMVEDKSGQLWLGTDGGVSRFDGKSFTNFTPEEGLAHEDVNAIAIDRSGKLWIGSYGGVSCYDPKITLSASQKPIVDFLHTDGTPFTNVRSIVEDQNGKIWIGGADGLFCYDGAGGSLHKKFTDFVGYILEDKSGVLWISAAATEITKMTSNNPGSMVMYKIDGSGIKSILEKTAPNDFQLFGIYEDKMGYLWIGTMNGVCRYDPRQKGGEAFHYFSAHNRSTLPTAVGRG